MSLNAIAVLRIPEDALLEGLGEGEVPIGAKTPQDGRWLASAYGGSILMRPIDDGALVDLGHEVGDVEPAQLGAALRAHLGLLLNLHEDARGVFVYPERARPASATTADAIIEAVGELGEWIPVVEEADMPGMPAGLEAMMGQMLGGLDQEQMQGLWAEAQQLLADPERSRELMEAAAQMMGGGMDLGALAAQAQKMAEQDPELVKRLERQLGGDDDEEEEG